LEVFQQSFKAACEIFELTKLFPKEELYSLTDQVRRSSRFVSANISEAFRRRYFPKVFISKLNESEGEAAETQVWIKFCLSCNYLNHAKAMELLAIYDSILKQIVTMRKQADKWSIHH
jgi:four helix bundle protein